MLPAYGYLAVAGAALAVIDARQRRLPDRLTLPSYPVALALLGLAALVQPGGGAHFRGALAGLGIALALFLAQAVIYPAGLGWGDVKLAGILGLYLGWLGLAVLAAGLFLGYLLAAVAGLGLIAAGRASRKTQLRSARSCWPARWPRSCSAVSSEVRPTRSGSQARSTPSWSRTWSWIDRARPTFGGGGATRVDQGQRVLGEDAHAARPGVALADAPRRSATRRAP